MELEEENASLIDGQASKVQQMNELEEQLTKAQEALVKQKKTSQHEKKKFLAANANLNGIYICLWLRQMDKVKKKL
jgi:peptide methionine sulfoxide reductase MsrB